MDEEKNSPSAALVELHLHLEGALRPALARVLWANAKHVPPPPAGGLAQDRWQFEDLGGFLRLFGWATRLLDGPDAYCSLLQDLLGDLDAQGVVHAELFVALGQMARAGVDADLVVPALAQVATEHAARGGVDAYFIADATWQWGVSAASSVLGQALQLRDHRVVGFGMGGDETALPLRDFAPIYRRAREEGLGVCCHAGEGTSAEAVRVAVEQLGVTRIGHGIAAVEDAGVVELLQAKGVTLEVCPGSNLRTGAWRLEQGPHPLLNLSRAGVPVVLGSDDPAFFETSLTLERSNALAWGATDDELAQWNLQAARAAFLPTAQRDRLLHRLDSGR